MEEDKLSMLREKLIQNSRDMPVEEKKQYLEMLRIDVQVEAMMMMIPKDPNTSGDREDGGGVVLQMRGQFARDASGNFVLPCAKALQAELVRIGGGHPEIYIFSEKNFNYITNSTLCPNHLLQEEEVFVKLDSQESASCFLNLKQGLPLETWCLDYGVVDPRRLTYLLLLHFSVPSRDAATRAVYRHIGALLTRLKRVNEELKHLGAVSGRGNIPVLPAHFVQTEEFDETVRVLQAKMKAVNDKPSRESVNDLQHVQEELHGYLVSKQRVNRRKRQEALDSLVDERISILLKLCRYDLDTTPFSFDREFV